MRLIAVTVDHQLPHIHPLTKDTECLMCVHRHTLTMGEAASTEAYRLSAQLQHLPTMRLEFDKSAMTATELRTYASILQERRQQLLQTLSVDASEYLYFIDNSAALSRQLLDALLMPEVEARLCTQEIFAILASELQRVCMSDISGTSVQCEYGLYAGKTTMIERSDIHSLCFRQFTHDWLHEYYTKGVICQFFLFDSQDTKPWFTVRYNAMYNLPTIYRRIVDINLLLSAPYGTVTVGVKTFCNSSEHSVEPLIYLTHSIPAAYKLAVYRHGKITARVSVANMASLNTERKHMFFNYAIYLPFDIDTAIYLRFGAAQVAHVLLHRLQKLEYIILTNKPTRTFRQLKLATFFDRGIFCAHIIDNDMQRHGWANQLRLELIDIYRNAYWMGLNIFHKDASLIFPRIIVRLGSHMDHELKTQRICTPICVSQIIQNIKLLLQQALSYTDQLPSWRKHLYEICKTSAEAAIDSHFAIAHESLRLALSMTHTSVHKYAEYADKCGVDSKYVRMAILYSGDTECNQCNKFYSSITPIATDGATVKVLENARSAFTDRIALLSNKTYTLLQSQMPETHSTTSVSGRMMHTLSQMRTILYANATPYKAPIQTLSSTFMRYNAIVQAEKYLDKQHIYTPHCDEKLLFTTLSAQLESNAHNILRVCQIKGAHDIQCILNKLVAQQRNAISLAASDRNTMHTDTQAVNSSDTNTRKRKHHSSQRSAVEKSTTEIHDFASITAQWPDMPASHITPLPMPLLSSLRNEKRMPAHELQIYYKSIVPHYISALGHDKDNNIIEKAYLTIQGEIHANEAHSHYAHSIQKQFHETYTRFYDLNSCAATMSICDLPPQVSVTDTKALQEYISYFTVRIIASLFGTNKSFIAALHGHIAETLYTLSDYIMSCCIKGAPLSNTIIHAYLTCYDLSYLSYASMK